MAAATEITRNRAGGGGVDLDEFDPNNLFYYRTAKRVKIKVWQLGVTYHVSTVALLVYVVYTIFTSAQWAATDDVSFSYNAWVGGGAYQSVSSADVPYCGNVSYDVRTIMQLELSSLVLPLLSTD